MTPFEPFFKNPHLSTIAGSYWRRPRSGRPVKEVRYRTEPAVEVLVRSQDPESTPIGELVIVHGLEGSSESGYAVSLAHAALSAGYATHRFNMRSCGDSESLALSNYHSGQTSDLLHVLREVRRLRKLPVFAAGFSLGGNVVLKLAGELGEDAQRLLAGVCAVSTPIDLEACAKALGKPENFLYDRKFLTALRARIRRRHKLAPRMYTLEHLKKIHTIFDFDDFYTARLFGFGTAENYYRTQSANQFLDQIQIPALVVQAKDDPLIPFSVYDHPAFDTNPTLKLIAVDHGGHVGFIARRNPRFWVDHTLLEWIAETNKEKRSLVS